MQSPDFLHKGEIIFSEYEIFFPSTRFFFRVRDFLLRVRDFFWRVRDFLLRVRDFLQVRDFDCEMILLVHHSDLVDSSPRTFAPSWFYPMQPCALVHSALTFRRTTTWEQVEVEIKSCSISSYHHVFFICSVSIYLAVILIFCFLFFLKRWYSTDTMRFRDCRSRAYTKYPCDCMSRFPWGRSHLYTQTCADPGGGGAWGAHAPPFIDRI